MHRPISDPTILELLDRPDGLSPAELDRQRRRHGLNNILDHPTHPWRELARDTAGDPMLWFLLGTSALYGFLGDRAEAYTLLLTLIPLIGMDAFLHRRTQASTAGLRVRLASHATVLRDGAPLSIPIEEVVPGDLAIVSAGEHFPADGILVDGDTLQADESSLTGEAYPVRKQSLASVSPKPAGQAGDSSWGFAGTRLLTGRAKFRVVWTGAETLYGEIVRSVMDGKQARTPLQLSIGRLVRVLLLASLALCACLAVVRLRQGFGWTDALMNAITLAVAALPEEFPVVFTLFLGMGVHRLAREKALVRRAVSVENIGRVSCICSDKTGTITLGQLQLTEWVPAALEGSPEQLRRVARHASRTESGDPMDEAIARAGEVFDDPAPSFEVHASFPFTEDRRRETTLGRTAEAFQAVTKGAPETIFSLCSISESERSLWAERAARLAAAGHKVIGCAARLVDESTWKGEEPDAGFEFVGLLGFKDAVREGVPEAIAWSLEAGIRVVMVTGDHPDTAAAVGREIGLGGDSMRVVRGDELEAMSESEQSRALSEVDIIARAIPAQKLAIVRAYQSAGKIVAVTGDGVNDVPALRAADVGIAMGERATRSAREVAAIVLLDDNFRTIVRAIAEGRLLFENLRQSFQYLLLIHIPIVFTAALVPLAGYPILYLPIHIVLLELMIHPSALLAFQDGASGDPQAHRQAERPNGFFARETWALIAGVGVLNTGLIAFSLQPSLADPREMERARALAVAMLSLSSAGFVSILSGLRTRISRWITALTLSMAGILIQVPALSRVLHLVPLTLDDACFALGGAAAGCFPLAVSEWARRDQNAP